jgi:general secretion pathway protein A
MYHEFFGLRELPFELTANPKYLFLTQQHREALSMLIYGLSTAKGLTALIGEAGTGKTTLLRAALQADQCRHVNCVYLVNPSLSRAEFVETLSAEFGLSAQASKSKAILLRELEAVLHERRSRGQRTALMIDEAQRLSDELLEEIRLLANTETTTEKLLSVVLAGQPELRDRLNETGLRQLKQRVTLRCEIKPFTQQETAAYIASRVRHAGGEAVRLFTREAVMLIHERSGGIARTISVMCDNALLTGFGLGRHRVDSEIVLEVARDFDLLEMRAPREGDTAPAVHEEPDANAADEGHAENTADPGPLTFATPVPVDETTADIASFGERPLFAATKTRSRFPFFGSR